MKKVTTKNIKDHCRDVCWSQQSGHRNHGSTLGQTFFFFRRRGHQRAFPCVRVFSQRAAAQSLFLRKKKEDTGKKQAKKTVIEKGAAAAARRAQPMGVPCLFFFKKIFSFCLDGAAFSSGVPCRVRSAPETGLACDRQPPLRPDLLPLCILFCRESESRPMIPHRLLIGHLFILFLKPFAMVLCVVFAAVERPKVATASTDDTGGMASTAIAPNKNEEEICRRCTQKTRPRVCAHRQRPLSFFRRSCDYRFYQNFYLYFKKRARGWRATAPRVATVVPRGHRGAALCSTKKLRERH